MQNDRDVAAHALENSARPPAPAKEVLCDGFDEIDPAHAVFQERRVVRNAKAEAVSPRQRPRQDVVQGYVVVPPSGLAAARAASQAACVSVVMYPCRRTNSSPGTHSCRLPCTRSWLRRRCRLRT